jgi:hypothetical protein
MKKLKRKDDHEDVDKNEIETSHHISKSNFQKYILWNSNRTTELNF